MVKKPYFFYNINIMKDKKLNYSAITVDPIQNFYENLSQKLPTIIDNLFNSYFENNKAESNKYEQFANNIEKNNIDLKNKKKSLKINSILTQNIFISIGFPFLIGFAFWKKFQSNRKIIKEFKNYKSAIQNNNTELETNKKISLYNFFYNFNLINIIKNISNDLGLNYRNYLFKNEYDIINEFLKPLWIDNAHVFLYKSSPIIDISFKLLNIRNVTTSKSNSYTYSDCVYQNGEYKTVIRSETLTAYHHEPTPFIDDYENLLFLTHFGKELNFTINNKPYLKFENDQFAKIFKINNINDSIDTNMLSFFTIKAQEDYVEFYKKNNKKLLNSFSKNGEVIDITNDSYHFNTNINSSLNIFHELNVTSKILDNINNLKTTLTNYFQELLKSITYPLISPMISREMYNNKDNNYRISNNQFDEFDNSNQSLKIDEINFYSILYKVFKPNFIYFLKHNPKRSPWLTINFVNKIDDYYFIDCYLNSYMSKELIDSISVSGRSGTHIIDVPYEKFYEIKEKKSLFFIPLEISKIPNFSISKNIDFSIFKNREDLSTSWLSKIPFFANNINYFLESKNEDLNNIIKTISKNLTFDISISKVDEGIIIINNNVDTNNTEFIDIIKNTVYKLKNL